MLVTCLTAPIALDSRRSLAECAINSCGTHLQLQEQYGHSRLEGQREREDDLPFGYDPQFRNTGIRRIEGVISLPHRRTSAHQSRELWIIAQQQAPARNGGQLGSRICHFANAATYLRQLRFGCRVIPCSAACLGPVEILDQAIHPLPDLAACFGERGVLVELQALDRCLEKLSPHDLDLVRTRYASDRGLDDYARSLSRSSGTMKARLFKIRAALRRCVESSLAGKEVMP